jgi:hypothetical protein
MREVDEAGTEARTVQAYDDVLYLTQFYGHMILAMSGWKPLEQMFTESHQKWKPSMTFTSGESPADNNPPEQSQYEEGNANKLD